MATAAAAPAKKWAREYETIYILRPDTDNDAAEKIVDRAKDVITRLDGTLTKLDNWGKRKLAYPIQKNTRGIFVYLKYVGFSDLVAELERNLRLLDEVVRFQTVLLEGDVDPSTVAVDPEEVQYLHVEEEEEAEDTELERARSLGMAPRAPREPGPEASDAPPAAEADTAADTGADADADTSADADTGADAAADTGAAAEADTGADTDAAADAESADDETKKEEA